MQGQRTSDQREPIYMFIYLEGKVAHDFILYEVHQYQLVFRGNCLPNKASHTQRDFILTSRIIRQQVIQYELLGFSQLMMMPMVSQRCANRNSLKDFTLAFELSLCTFTPSTIAHKISGACMSSWFYKTQQFSSLCMGKMI